MPGPLSSGIGWTFSLKLISTGDGINRGHREGGPTAHLKNFKTTFFKRY
jgi:hypothetical protein